MKQASLLVSPAAANKQGKIIMYSLCYDAHAMTTEDSNCCYYYYYHSWHALVPAMMEAVDNPHRLGSCFSLSGNDGHGPALTVLQ